MATTDLHTAQPSTRLDTPIDAPDGHRSRRSLLTAGAMAIGGAVAASLGAAVPAEAASAVILGAANSETTPTTIKNTAASASARAIIGQATAAGANGVQGLALGSGGIGVNGTANTGGGAVGVVGQAAQGIGVRANGVHGVHATGSYQGVYANASASNGNGVNASGKLSGVSATGGTYGVQASGASYGVYVPQAGPYGVYASGTTSGADFFGGPWGVYGVGSSYGVEGIATGSSGSVYGLYGYASTSGATCYGVYGSGSYAGVFGSSDYVGVWGGQSTSAPTYGLVGYGATYGLWCTANGSGTVYAVYGAGTIRATGFVSGAAGTSLIDHPLDPERKWLAHSFVQSPDMLSVYSGVAALDAKGRATVTLPKYFGALNRDFRYQLTAIGGAAPSLHVAQKIAGNRFRIAGGTSGLEVSWQVTGIRKDDYAVAHPIVVETPKTKAERGTRQFVPAGSPARLMDPGPRPVEADTHANHPPRQPAVPAQP